MSHAPVISIGLPVYNAESFVDEAIRSHLAQSYHDFELVISDNCSTDATFDICQRHARADRRIRLLRQSRNVGVNRNHRVVFDAAAGAYFRWTGADDRLDPEFLGHAAGLLDADPAVVAIVPDTANIDDSGSIIRRLERNLHLLQERPSERARTVLTAGYQMVFTMGLIRRETLLATSRRWDYFGWDFILLLDLALRGRLLNVEGPLLYRRHHAGSTALNTRSVDAVRRWIDPSLKGRMLFPHWRWARERLRVALRAPLTADERLRVLALVARHAWWNRGSLVRDVVMAGQLKCGRIQTYPF